MKLHGILLTFLLLLVLAPVPAESQIHISGVIEGTLVDTTYIVDDDLFVGNQDTVLIEAGCVFLFDGLYQLSVSGYLEAIGTEEDSIYFRPNDDVIGWESIRFTGQPDDSCRMDYCVIEGTLSGGINCNVGAAPVITNSRFTDNSATYGGGIYISASNPRISYCTFTDNSTTSSGGAIYCTNASPQITHCLFTNNAGGNWGGAINNYNNSTSLILSCEFYQNTANSTGGAINCSNSDPTIRDCIIDGNTAENYGGGINCYNTSEPVIEKCLIVNNTCTIAGGGVYSTISKPSISKCTIANNNGGSWGGGIYYYDSQDALLTHSIIYNNFGTGNVYVSLSNPLITFCDIYSIDEDAFGGSPQTYLGLFVTTNGNGDECDINYNIYLNPGFSIIPEDAFHLTAGSPCIDTGDPTLPMDPDDTYADMGVFYYDHEINGGEPPDPPPFTVSGTCLLRFQDNHEDANVVFIPRSPLVTRDSVLTETNGSFEIEISQGVYDVLFTRDGFVDSLVQEVEVLGTTVMQTVLLNSIGISGALSGTLEARSYLVSDHITVLEEDSLFLLPGTRFLFSNDLSFTIHGFISAIGTAEDSIAFVTVPEAISWNGIDFESASSDSCRFEYCLISGSVDCGVYCTNSSPVLINCTIRNNLTGYYGGGGMTAVNLSHPVLERCVIADNASPFPGGGIFIADQSGCEIINCVIANNDGNSGDGIYCMGNTTVVKNTIFSGNVGSAMFLDAAEESIFEYNIFDNIGADEIVGIAIPAGLGDLSTTNLYGDSCDVYSNLFLHARLNNPGNGDFTLSSHSPAINSGSPDSPLDGDGTIADMGAVPYTILGSNLRLIDLSHEFGQVPVEQTESWYIKILNTGFEDLVINDIESSRPLIYLVELLDPLTIVPGAIDSVEVVFSPALPEIEYSGTITLISNDPVWSESYFSVHGWGGAVSVDGYSPGEIPESYALASLYPNPFNSSVNIVVAAPEKSLLKLRIYNILGEAVYSLNRNIAGPGYYDFSYDATGLSSGVYIVRVQAENKFNEVRKIILLR